MFAWMFPGQGTQAIGMGKGLFERFPGIVEEADELLGYSTRKLCLEGPESRLNRTAFAQPLIYVCNALHLADLRAREGREADFCIGHSLGEYSALFAAGAFDFVTGLRLVRRRGELFEQCGEGAGMAAVMGLTLARIRAVLRNEGLLDIHVANMNTARQTVIAGPLPALEKARAALEAADCSMYRPLAVSGAFHCPHVTPIKAAFMETLNAVEFEPLRIPVISNVTARPYKNGRLPEYLGEQIDHPVRWAESIRYVSRQGVTDWQEVGHGNVLAALCRALLREQRQFEEQRDSAVATENAEAVLKTGIAA
jgi:malonyl CoA-acyl carrier protein transacylase